MYVSMQQGIFFRKTHVSLLDYANTNICNITKKLKLNSIRFYAVDLMIINFTAIISMARTLLFDSWLLIPIYGFDRTWLAITQYCISSSDQCKTQIRPWAHADTPHDGLMDMDSLWWVCLGNSPCYNRVVLYIVSCLFHYNCNCFCIIIGHIYIYISMRMKLKRSLEIDKDHKTCSIEMTKFTLISKYEIITKQKRDANTNYFTKQHFVTFGCLVRVSTILIL